MSATRRPNEQPVFPDGPIDFHLGPDFIGVGQEHPWEKRWIVWVSTAGIRYAIWTPGMAIHDSAGSPNVLFTGGERPGKVSLGFDQDNQPVIAIQQTATQIRLRKKVSGVVTTFDWTGESPQIWCNCLAVVPTGATDVVCFYIKPPYDKIYLRVQRDAFGVEYVLNPTLLVGTSINRFLKADSFREAGLTRQYLIGKNAELEHLEFRSKVYPPFPVFMSDKLPLTNAFQAGAHAVVIVAVTQSTEKLNPLLNSLESGVYALVVISATQPTEKLNPLNNLFQSGDYALVMVAATQPTEKLNPLVNAFQTGAHTEVVQSAGTYTEKVTLTNALQSGNYAV